MKIKNAINKLEKAGWQVSGKNDWYEAEKDGVYISFTGTIDVSGGFTYNSDNSCAPTYGMSLKQAMA